MPDAHLPDATAETDDGAGPSTAPRAGVGPDEPEAPERPDELDESDRPDEPRERPNHLADVEDGCGCVEVWEHLSERRDG
jgi:hypothetical protein